MHTYALGRLANVGHDEIEGKKRTNTHTRNTCLLMREDGQLGFERVFTIPNADRRSVLVVEWRLQAHT